MATAAATAAAAAAAVAITVAAEAAAQSSIFSRELISKPQSIEINII